MALVVYTSTPRILLKAIREAIDNGEIKTWRYDKDGDFVHTSEQWKGRAWLTPSVSNGLLQFGLIGQAGVDMTKVVYSFYHGHFIEMLLTHFDENFSGVNATALADTDIDVFK